ncbi:MULTISPECIES: hypothetical protein [Streptomyces]|uniref:Uncharacterized protein n=2 Tax=Streptomyces TaxID=1883 RepID=A0ABV4SVZ3_9ACTN|nr:MULTISPECIES: hypothetical protein [unclassified Streptomyces]WSE01070.1 hypothetical protein OG758_47270 [Streptomyces sp. NBC_01474]
MVTVDMPILEYGLPGRGMEPKRAADRPIALHPGAVWQPLAVTDVDMRERHSPQSAPN